MAPVGSFDALHAAIQGGADSVYFGIGKLNMRARSTVNFTPDDLVKIIRICRNFNKRAYLTLNAVIYNHELEQVRDIVHLAKEKGIHAVIASDQAVLHYCRDKDMEVHLSTQLNISNIETLKFYARFADVAVLARELTLEQVSEMAGQIKKQQIRGPSGELMKIELFVHGALCMAVSGKCYLSLHHYNQSANRGACLQDCRRAYTVKERETGFDLDLENEYIMSPKDLCTIHFLDQIIDAGVRVLKIEGRARSPEYVKTVVSCYSEAIDDILAGRYSRQKAEKLNEKLKMVFNRGFWDGYYLGKRTGEWSDAHGSKALKKKIYIAKSLNYYHKLGVGEFLCESDSLKTGDEILIIGPNTGVIETTIEEMHNDTGPVKSVNQGERFSIPLPRKVRRADKLYKMVEA
ncbi:MAG: U32 family peptidase [Bacteroidales bacterium]|nr:U32 family peptidase [Bacteroidales bacterium]